MVTRSYLNKPGTVNKFTLKRKVTDIIVIVAGTVDPVNSSDIIRALSYDPVNGKNGLVLEKMNIVSGKVESLENYWEENEGFQKRLKALKSKYNDLHIFDIHGWSGDNNLNNREIAGKYLVDRLCGSNGEKPYYPKFKEKWVSFHLIGHSHGGNVINEMTKAMATNQGWPEKWKVKSITYLSTPFFSKLHQVNTEAFHEKCQIINADYNGLWGPDFYDPS